jgi:nitroreductase
MTTTEDEGRAGPDRPRATRSAEVPEDPEGIPDVPEGTLPEEARVQEFDEGAPVGPTPAFDFWDALYGRRSVRKFKPDPVERELVEQVMHAGIWAPSSCNYQMWDLVAVDDAEVNRRLGELSLQMANAPVNVVVSYGRDFSEEGWANVQSASALIENMSLAAHVLGLGTFWITQMGDREQVREIVGLPYDRLVIAVLAIGWPASVPKSGPRRRPLAAVAHWNHYAGRAIPSSTDPSDWPADLLAVYQRARVLNGLRHNKPRPWETRALLECLERLLPDEREKGREKTGVGAERRWLDVLPCTGILTERLARERPGYRFDVVERTPDVAAFCAGRTRPRAGAFAWPAESAQPGFAPPPPSTYDVVSCLFRLEDLAPDDRPRLLEALASWVQPGGTVLLGYVSKRSFHDWTERLRARRGGPGGVEYVLSPDPNIGPFESLSPARVEELCNAAGLSIRARLGLQAVPAPEEIAFRTRNFSPRSKQVAGWIAALLGALEKLPGVQSARGRFRFLKLERRA